MVDRDSDASAPLTARAAVVPGREVAAVKVIQARRKQVAAELGLIRAWRVVRSVRARRALPGLS